MQRTRTKAAALAALVGSLLLVSLAAAAPAPRATPKPPGPTARSFAGTPTVGAIFKSATSTDHTCTASVVDSPQGNLLITAAHCLKGTGRGLVFAPAFHNGISPDGRWAVTAIHLSPGWLKGQSTLRDYAFLTVAPRRIDGKLTEIQQVTGANRLASTAPAAGTEVTVPAYNDGAKNPITCTAKLAFDGVYPTFNCNPYVDGASGSPFLVHTRFGTEVVGVIGGLHQGGCQTYTSYSAPLGDAAVATYAAAITGARANVAPKAGSDGCSTGL
jgi:V8-like Glu-specific endopeptidase